MADEPTYRREIKSQSNLQEGRHALARRIFHSKRGQLYQRYSFALPDLPGGLRSLGEPGNIYPDEDIGN